MRWIFWLLLVSIPAAAQTEAPNAILLIAKPGLQDPNFRETVVLVTQAADASTIGVILNRPTAEKHPQTGDTLYFGGPVMREVLVALFRAERSPDASAFPVLKGVYLTMHPQNIETIDCTPDFPAGPPASSKARCSATAGTCCRRARSWYFAKTRPECGRNW